MKKIKQNFSDYIANTPSYLYILMSVDCLLIQTSILDSHGTIIILGFLRIHLMGLRHDTKCICKNYIPIRRPELRSFNSKAGKLSYSAMFLTVG
jgi:hypothetical protein